MIATTHEGKTSLEILGIKPSGKGEAPTATEEYLKGLSITLLEILNNKNFEDPSIKHLAPDIYSEHTADHQTVIATSRDDLVDAVQSMVAEIPDYHAEFLDSGAKVTERTGKGTVWVLRLLTGLSDGLRRESVSVLHWELRDGEWLCTKHRGLRSIPWRDFGESELELKG